MPTPACHLGAGMFVLLSVATASAQPPSETTPLRASVAAAARSVQDATPPNDPLWDGIALGAVIGAATSLGFTAISFARCDEGCSAPEPGPFYAISAGFGGAVGAFAGWLIDRARKPKPGTTITIAPVITKPRQGVAVRVAF